MTKFASNIFDYKNQNQYKTFTTIYSNSISNLIVVSHLIRDFVRWITNDRVDYVMTFWICILICIHARSFIWFVSNSSLQLSLSCLIRKSERPLMGLVASFDKPILEIFMAHIGLKSPFHPLIIFSFYLFIVLINELELSYHMMRRRFGFWSHGNLF